MDVKAAFLILLLGIMLLGCTQPSTPSATPSTASEYVKIGVSKLSAEVPQAWKVQISTGNDISYTDPLTKSSILMSSVPMAGKNLRDFASEQINLLEDKLSLSELSIGSIKNGEPFRVNNHEWYAFCYSFSDEAGKETGQCTAITQCGSDAGIVLLNSEKAKLASGEQTLMHALGTFNC